MKDIGKYHHAHNIPRPISEFFRSAPYLQLYDHLRGLGLSEPQVVQRGHACKGTPSGAVVHPLVALEYLRWVDYGAYCEHLTTLLERSDV